MVTISINTDYHKYANISTNLSFTHTFKNLQELDDPEKEYESSSFYNDGCDWWVIAKMKSTISCQSSSNKPTSRFLQMVLYAKPRECKIRVSDDWAICADVERVAGNSLKVFNDLIFQASNKSDYVIGEVIYDENYEDYLNSDVQNKDQITVTISIRNRRLTGLRFLPCFDFRDSNFKCADIILKLGEEKLYCHSQLLRLNSSVFDEAISTQERRKKQKMESIIDELHSAQVASKRMKFSNLDEYFLLTKQSLPEIEIILPNKKDIKSDDFINFLYHLYVPNEIITDDNVEKLLILSECFNVETIKHSCAEYIKEKTKETSQAILLSWKYNLTSIKNSILLRIKDASELSTIVADPGYKNINKINKIELCENFVWQSQALEH